MYGLLERGYLSYRQVLQEYLQLIPQFRESCREWVKGWSLRRFWSFHQARSS